jgi:hypothetical protein
MMGADADNSLRPESFEPPTSGCGKLLAPAEFSGELDHDNHGKFC